MITLSVELKANYYLEYRIAYMVKALTVMPGHSVTIHLDERSITIKKHKLEVSTKK